MLRRSCVLLICLLTLTLFQCSVDSLRLTQENIELDIMNWLKREEERDCTWIQWFWKSALHVRSIEQKAAGDLTPKWLLPDHLVHLQNNLIETKRKRSFPGSNTPLDRLSVSTMDPKGSRPRKVVELPRRRGSAPIDRIGAGRLPSSRG